ncbi:MAG: pentapeptide repeat-containing protein [Phototrophicaceae bacterium]
MLVVVFLIMVFTALVMVFLYLIQEPLINLVRGMSSHNRRTPRKGRFVVRRRVALVMVLLGMSAIILFFVVFPEQFMQLLNTPSFVATAANDFPTVLQDRDPNTEGIQLDGVELLEVNLFEASLAGASLTNAKLWNSTLTSAMLEGANLSGARIWQVNFEMGNFREALFINTVINETNFTRSILQDSSFIGAVITDTNFTNAELWHVDFSGTQFLSVNFDGAQFWEADLEGAQFAGNTIFSPTTILPDGTNWSELNPIDRFTNRQHPNFWRSDKVWSPAYEYRAIPDTPTPTEAIPLITPSLELTPTASTG